MEELVSTWFVGALVTLLGILGLVLTAGARDNGMFVFGFSLAASAVLFMVDLLRRRR